ncbi:MAG: ABC transporter permease subunit [Clostridia bacterium]|nr:ABC transporter permease subunit [Clostridia bacterium]
MKKNKLGAHLLLTALCLIWLTPFVLLVLQSFRGESGGQVAYVLPREWTLDNYAFLLRPESGFLRWFANTLTIALFCAVIQTIMVLSVAYALSRLRFRGRRLLMNLMLVVGMFPGFLTMIVLYYLLKLFGLTQGGAVPGLILVYTASSGLGYHIAKGFFDTIPRTLDEAARIDGATRFQVFWRIILPMAKPIVIYTVLMAFMAPWGDYVFASYVAFGAPEGYNVAVGLYRWVNTTDYQGYFTRFCAGGVVVALPVTALFMALQRYYVEGITGGAVKG